MIFDFSIKKKEFHSKQAKLTFEEKIGILIELQKLDLEIRPKKEGDGRMVWKID